MLSSKKHINIPVFLPEKACPNRCIYCNQYKITGVRRMPSINDIIAIVDKYLSSIDVHNTDVEIAFFGGNFTGLSFDEQENILKPVQQYIHDGKVKSIRLSTRPDFINEKNLEMLKKYHVDVIELGVQSLDDEVLRASQRGYAFKDVENAATLIKKHGFKLCLQMMIGLPLDTLKKSLYTAHKIVDLGAAMTRIYPVLVIKDTLLEKMFHDGAYKPLALTEAVRWATALYKHFSATHVKVLKMGLHPSTDLMCGDNIVAGPFHMSFAELVLSNLWEEYLMPLKGNDKVTAKIYVNKKDINHAIGYKGQNKKKLETLFKKAVFEIDSKLQQHQFYVDYI